MQKPPGPKGHAIIGNLEAYEEDRIGFLTRCAREFGDVAAYSDSVYIVSRPDLVEHILTTTNRDFMVPDNLLRQGIAEDNIAGSMQKRRVIGRGLHRRAINNYAPKVVDLTKNMLEQWQPQSELNTLKEMERLTSNVIADYCFGVHGKMIPSLAASLLNALFPVVSSPFVFPPWFPSPARLRVRWILYRLDQAIYRIIHTRRKASQETTDMLSALMDTDSKEEVPSDTEICEVLVSVLIASLGVPAAALSWIWYLLAQHPEKEAKVHLEIAQVLKGQLPTTEDINKLKYINCVVNEALRLYPPTWLTDRKVLKNCEIDGYTLSRGQRVLFSSYVIHRDPRYFDLPEEFIPERWLDEEKIKKIPKYAYFPFGGGPRVCLGAALSMIEIVLVVATVARSFRLRLADNVIVIANSRRTLVPANLRMIVEPIAHQSTIGYKDMSISTEDVF